MGRLLVLSTLLLMLASVCSSLWLGECNKPLGVSTGDLQDRALTASSAHDHIVGPHRARLGVEEGGGAWCPSSMVDASQREWLEVDFGALRLVTAVATQGRHANGQGQEYTPAYTLSYWRPGMVDFTFYSGHPSKANKTLLVGNSDTYTEVKNNLARPLLATKVRLQPFSSHKRVVCLRLELFGCNYTDGLVSYSLGGGPTRSLVGAGVGDSVSVGEGLLFDGLVGLQGEGGQGPQHPMVEVEGLEPAPDVPTVMTFNFDVMRKFRSLHIYLLTSQLTAKPKMKAKVTFGSNSSLFDDTPLSTTWTAADLSPAGPQNLTFDLRQRPALTLQLEAVVSGMEANILEVYFDSYPCGCRLGDFEARPATTPEERTAARPLDPPDEVWAVYTAHQHRTYVGVAVGFSVGVGVLVLVWAGVWLRRRRGKSSSPRVFRRPPPDTLDMKSLMEGVGVNVGVLGSSTPTYEEGSCLLYEDLQKMPLVSTPRPATPDSTPVYATPTLKPSSTFPSTSYFAPIPRPVTLASIPRPPPIPPPPEKFDSKIQVPSVTGPWLTAVYRQEHAHAHAHTATPTLSPERVTRTELLASGAFATLSAGVVGGEEACEGDTEPTLCHAALITVTAHKAVPVATRHAQLLASITHENVCRLLGVVVGGPVGVTLVLEYHLDSHLPEYLQRRTLSPAHYMPPTNITFAPSTITTTTGVGVGGGGSGDAYTNPYAHISVGGLVGVAVQVAAGMAHLESLHITHTDLAARNVVVVGGETGIVKVTQVGSALPRYASDYWRAPDGRGPAPLRWCAPEVLCQGSFTPAGDVWSFGVTLWEILTLARRRPHHHLSDDLLFHALVSTHAHLLKPAPADDTYATPQVQLTPPAWCPREVQDVMSSCWRPHPSQRPSFVTIHAILAAQVTPRL